MAKPEHDLTNVTQLAARRPRRPQGEHAWLVPHLISLIGYAERHKLHEVEHALSQAAERVAPAVRRPSDPEHDAGAERLVLLHGPRPERRD
ncbi:hypothetical protein [Rhodobacter sp. CZR27]|uniref:hypothetical protein n=1 Tax=Rhodobacter sp. CZR27 TaxID=2033869 RepID=UPI000BBE9E21|nr:hypothetical protein [Rhodobacter sp. CZR27]